MKKTIKKILKVGIFSVALVVFFIIIVFITIRATTQKHIWNNIAGVPHSEVAVILGASILKDGNLSPVLKDRVDMAINLYEAEKVDKILVTGDNSTLSHNEVSPVRLYLLEKGIPDNIIFLDHAGFDTYSSMYRARDIFLASKMTIVTQSFHLPRAVFIARELGIDASGMSADIGHYKFSNSVREIFANEKAVMNLFFNRKPKFLGEEIPIAVVGEDGQQCYSYNHEAKPDEPYAVSEFINLTIDGNKITGTKTGTQKGPDMTNGYSGTLTGTVENNTFNITFAYTIEGSQNQEKEIYRLKQDKTGIEKFRYPLIEKTGILVPDTTKEYQALFYARTVCLTDK